ncbi:hypothetical protein BsIDN1_70840 [Bacillus safensis]|uniref:Uncharacterized protein n=1 Tax=Bacillus safensis TaxID=561879 RepID=A0A5S9MNW5_BACIA|nr:hypothetical protein BsIDN1_70840 [Bacillus safensis]
MLLHNQAIFENYYSEDQRGLWDIFEGEILSNNRILRKKILKHNTKLIQKAFSGKLLKLSNSTKKIMLHIDEFEATRISKKKKKICIISD